MTRSRNLRFIKCLLLVSLPLTIFPAYADQQALESELNSFIDRYKSSSYLLKKQIIEEIYWKGFSDARFWDLVANDVKNNLKEMQEYEQEFNAKIKSDSPVNKELYKDNLLRYADKTAHTIKWLAVSGNEKYRSFIRNIQYKDPRAKGASKHVRKVAKFRNFALENLSLKASRNKIIIKGLKEADKKQHDRIRVRNMLTSQDFRLIKVGTKFTIEQYADDQELADIAHDVFITHYRTADEQETVRALTNICKALAANGDPIYKRTLEDAASNAKHTHVKKAAAKYLTLF